MYIIFLDIDGVLNTEHGLKTISDNWTNLEAIRDTEDGKEPFCPTAIEVLKRIIDETGAKIVISSTWRSDGLEWFQDFWKNRGLPGEIIDITPYEENRVRGREVDNWLHRRGYYYPTDYWSAPAWVEARESCYIEGYCIIDDDWDFFIQQTPHYVNTPAYYGLAGEGKYEEVLKALAQVPK